MNNKSTILIVDDTPENIDILTATLHGVYKTKAALNGKKALEIAQKKPHPDMILLDVMMPDMDGYEVCQKLKENPLTAKIPIIFITAMSDEASEEKGLDLGAVDYILKPISPSITMSRIKTHLALSDQNRALESQVYARTKELDDSRLELVRRLGRAAEYKDNETGLHVLRMSHYARLIAESLVGESNAWTQLLFQAMPMHDIGKIGIPDHILLKEGPLDDDEWALMQQHSQFGSDIIGEHDSPLLQMAYEVALSHHEKWDGSGYPHGIEGEAIPLSARVAAIADVFDALTSERPYKEAWSTEKALGFIKEQSGKQFDPHLVKHFELMESKIIEIKNRFAESKA